MHTDVSRDFSTKQRSVIWQLLCIYFCNKIRTFSPFLIIMIGNNIDILCCAPLKSVKNAQLAWWGVTNPKSEWNFPIIWALATRLIEEKQGRWRHTQQFGGNRWPLRTWYMKLITLSQIQLVAGRHYLNFHNSEEADIKWGFQINS